MPETPNLLPVDVLLEDGPVLVVNKPGGLLTQSPPNIDSLEDRIKAWLIHRDNKPGKAYLGVPHRLDRPATGAMVFAKHSRAARRLAEQFEGRLVGKTYLTMVAGKVVEDAGTWVDHLRKIPDMAGVEVVSEDHPEGKQAVLHFRVLSRSASHSLLSVRLETGRTHQIRIQTASRGYAIVGDEQYGSTENFGPPSDDPRMRWIALHSRQLEFSHPMTQKPIAITAPLPSAWDVFGLDQLLEVQ